MSDVWEAVLMGKRFDREKYLSIGFLGVKPTDTRKRERAPRSFPYVSSSLPRKGDPRSVHKGKFDRLGKPIIASKAQEDHIEKASHGRYKIV